MNAIWTFSPSSQKLLQQCLETASPADKNIKWAKALTKTTVQVIEISDTPTEQMEIDTETINCDANNDISSSEKRVLESISDDTMLNLDEIINKNVTTSFLRALANKLPVPSIETWLENCSNNENIDGAVLEKILTIFFPEFTKRHYSRVGLKFIEKISKLSPNYYKLMLDGLIKDQNVPANVVNDHVMSLNTGGKTEFMEHLTTIQFSSKTFEHNLSTILSAYKECIKSDLIQNFISQSLIDHMEQCKNNKNFGALILEYLRNERDSKHIIYVKTMSKVIEIHNSPFKRPCLMILKEITEK